MEVMSNKCFTSNLPAAQKQAQSIILIKHIFVSFDKTRGQSPSLSTNVCNLTRFVSGNLVHFSSTWYIVSRKVWQPCFRSITQQALSIQCTSGQSTFFRQCLLFLTLKHTNNAQHFCVSLKTLQSDGI
jgi:hypothetical protein